MEFNVNKDELVQCLYLIQGVVENRSPLPILSHVLISSGETGEDAARITLAATDLEISIRQQCAAQVKDAGSITASARKLYEIMRELPPGQVSLRSSGDDKVVVTSGTSRFQISSLDPKEFPSVKDKAEADATAPEAFVQLPGATLREMIEKTLFATSADETRLNLSGVFLETDTDGKLRMVSSDGHRLALIEKEVEAEKQPDWPNVILPKKGMVETRKIVERGEDEVGVAVSESVVRVKKDTTELSMRLVEGEFPDYRQVFPKDHTHRVEFQRDAMLSALRRILILTTERSRGVQVQFEKEKITLSVNTPDVGEGREEVATSYAGDGLSIGFNARYLVEALNVMTEGSDAVLSLKDEMSPGLLQSQESSGFSYVIMPMKIT